MGVCEYRGEEERRHWAEGDASVAENGQDGHVCLLPILVFAVQNYFNVSDNWSNATCPPRPRVARHAPHKHKHTPAPAPEAGKVVSILTLSCMLFTF